MILQELCKYYDRKISEDDAEMPSYGISMEGISFALVIDREGHLQDILDLRDENKKKLVPRKIPVPAAVTRTSKPMANYLWDKSSYVLGADTEGSHAQNKKRFAAFRQQLARVSGSSDDAALQL